MSDMAPSAPKPHDPRTPSISVDDLRGQYDAALSSDPHVTEQGRDGEEAAVTDELALELARYEAAYGVLASALQDGA